MEGSHQMFSEVTSLLACVGPQCIFCLKKELANKYHLQKKHLREAIYFLENNQEKCVVACYCTDSKEASRCHYHCPFCDFKVLHQTKDEFTCPHCTAVLSAPKNLKRHIRDVHNIDTTPMTCIDIRNGIYVTPKYGHSPFFPIHVIKSTYPPKIDCEVNKCHCLVIRKYWKIMCTPRNNHKCQTVCQASNPHIYLNTGHAEQRADVI
ncbi:hypothetical protein N1851_000280 [Merluccius polli]|uniref:C2H2-type domain-containing protein n=1 Tax=Merluccius polli TaxID=89951 RepID=A0AA47PBY5_MERPO|nr:hypothetical protein N1851_000280 [Merluccius polli]